MNRPNNSELPKELWTKVVNNSVIRQEIARKSHLLFFHIYLSHYIQYETAPFHYDFFNITENEQVKLAVIEAFRGSAKTSIMSLSYPIWAIVGKQQKKCVLLLSQTQQQARQYLANIKSELETNQLLKRDLGPFEEPDDEWRSVSIVIPKYDAKIAVASVDQTIRGFRHGPYRPDLIICDDLEDLNSVRSLDVRNKLYEWLMGDIVPLGNPRVTRIIVIGTKLHNDSLIMRLKKMIAEEKLAGISRSYPIIHKTGEVAWPGKFPDKASLETLRKSIDPRAWRREYLLEIVGDVDQVIDLSWIKYYNHLPTTEDHFLFTMTSIDLAISESERADYTAMVTAKAYAFDEEIYFYVLPDPVNERLVYPDILARTKQIINMVQGQGGFVVAEDVAFQRAFIHDVETFGANVIGYKPGKLDKRSRLSLTSGKVKAGHVLFPTKGAEQLIDQLVHFGSGHDDLADAFSMLIIEGTTLHVGSPRISFV